MSSSQGGLWGDKGTCTNTSLATHVHYTYYYRGGDFLERARCMTLLVHAYQLQNSDIYSFMVALRQLNTVEEAEEDIHEARKMNTNLCILHYRGHLKV